MLIKTPVALPFILSAVGILLLPITYVHGKTTDYSLGPKAYALYGSIVVYLIQMFIPESLLVVVASTLILLGLILSNENAEKYMDERTLLFNQYSFETVLEEFDFEKQKLYIAVICFCKASGIPLAMSCC